MAVEEGMPQRFFALTALLHFLGLMVVLGVAWFHLIH
jgi:hypothetical protein